MNNRIKSIFHHILFIGLLSVALGSCLSAAGSDRPRLLFLLAHGFNADEFFEPYFSFSAMGYDVDVASFEPGVVLFDPENRSPNPDGRDAFANLALSEVKGACDYVGLIIPGGYSPGNLEKDPDAIRIVTEFMKAGKPVGALCHGPRLLARAGLLQGKVVTAWNEIASEIPGVWRSGQLGTYKDEAVVVDGNLVTCRFPNDAPEWVGAFARMLAGHGGISPPETVAHVIYIAPHLDHWHKRRFFSKALAGNHVEARLLRDEDALVAASETPETVDAVVVFPDNASQVLLASPSGQDLLEAVGSPPVIRVKSETLPRQLREIVSQAHAYASETVPGQAAPVARAVIALAEGFDDEVAIAMKYFLEKEGFEPVLLAHDRGWVRGLGGFPLEAAFTYDDPSPMDRRAVVVAPGGIWPRLLEKARQADGQDALAAQAERDRQRAEWVTERFKAGDLVVLVGFDSMWLTADPVYAGLRMVSSDQTAWSFKRNSAGTLVKDVTVVQGSDNLITAKGAEAVPELMRLLEGRLP